MHALLCCSRPHLLKVRHVHRLLHVILPKGPAKQTKINLCVDGVNIWVKVKSAAEQVHSHGLGRCPCLTSIMDHTLPEADI